MVICLERGADLHMIQLMPLPLTVSCFSKIQIGFTFLVPAHPGSTGKRAVKQLCVCVGRKTLLHTIPTWVTWCTDMGEIGHGGVESTRWTHSPSRLAWSEGWRPPGAQSTFIR